MMTHPASEKLSKTEFNSLEDWQTYPTADYTCDKCNQTVSLSFRDFAIHQFSDFSNFNDKDKKLFEHHENFKEQTKASSFLDFYCPSCKRPVRILYESWGGGRHMEYGYNIKFVVD